MIEEPPVNGNYNGWPFVKNQSIVERLNDIGS